MKNKAKEVMVIDIDILFAKQDPFHGIIPAEKFDFNKLILEKFTWMDRKKAEQDPTYKQPIGYLVIYNPRRQEIFAYKRSKANRGSEERRLRDKWSCGVGGHIEREDDTSANPIYSSTLRELQEEVGIKDAGSLQVLGYINDDSEPVGRVHFGILYLLTVDYDEITPKTPEMSEGGLVSIRAFEEKCNSGKEHVEGWSEIVIKALGGYLRQLASNAGQA